MLNQNIKRLRTAKNFSQEELALRLNVVRQTVSKWEKGLSVPDAEMLVRLAEVFEVSVGDLLGSSVSDERSTDRVAEELMHINEQLAIKNNRSRRFRKTLRNVLIVVGLLYILAVVLFLAVNYMPEDQIDTKTTIEVSPMEEDAEKGKQ